MPQTKKYITREDVPDDVYCKLSRVSQRHFDYLLKLLDLMQLPSFDLLHTVRYEDLPGLVGTKGWQIISNLTPDRELRFYLKSHVASPKNPLYYMVYYVPTRVYEYFVDAASRGGFGAVIMDYPEKQKKDLTASGVWTKRLADDCIKCLKATNKRQAKSDQTQKVSLQEYGYSHLGDEYQQFFDMLKDGRVGEDELIKTINVVYHITSFYDKTRGS